MKYKIGDKVRLILDESKAFSDGVIPAWKKLPKQIATIKEFTDYSFAKPGYYMEEIAWDMV